MKSNEPLPQLAASPHAGRSVPRRAVTDRVVYLLELISAGRRFVTGDLPSEIVEDVVYVLDDLERELRFPREKRLRCGNCGADFSWPGELDHHQRTVHWGEAWKAAA